MPSTEIEKIKEQLSNVLSTIDPTYIDALLTIHKRLAKTQVVWAVGGDMGEILKTVQVQPDCIEILTDCKGANDIFFAFKDLVPKDVLFQTQRVDRNAVIEGKEYPVYTRSYYFEFTANGAKVKVFGDLQYRIGDWEWGHKLEFVPDHVSIVGAKTAIVPLQIKQEIYQGLGWTNRAEKIEKVLKRHPVTPR